MWRPLGWHKFRTSWGQDDSWSSYTSNFRPATDISFYNGGFYQRLPRSCQPPATDNKARPTEYGPPSSSVPVPTTCLCMSCCSSRNQGRRAWEGDNIYLESIAGALPQIQLIFTPHCWDVSGCYLFFLFFSCSTPAVFRLISSDSLAVSRSFSLSLFLPTSGTSA